MNVNTRSNCLSKPMRRIGRRYGVLCAIAIASLSLSDVGLIWAPLPARAQTSTPKHTVSVCVVVPHFKDEYWLSVGFGLQEEADAMGIQLLVYESGGYHALARQIALLQTCISKGADAILLGAVSADDPELLAAIQVASQTAPVIALVNELHSPNVAAAIGVDWRKMGYVVGEFLAKRHPVGSLEMQAGFVTGPKDSGWSPLLESGLRSALSGSSVEIVATRHADTGMREQLREVEDILNAETNLDYLIGSAPAIEGAMGLSARSAEIFPKMIATYISHSVRRGLQSGAVLAVPFDDPVEQGRLGVRMAQKSILGKTYLQMIGPPINLIESGSVDQVPLSPAGFLLSIE
ncbi:TMAO reductase system periplasmic protein TorT [Shimia sediminis]|uniref:TMAO reductase system periplasmic protein TorT n=1 Tax=Shimia sediminis TaxID=2497945 RepID=UPI000F8D7992|nr:TMAO reductase system periplasmic protein TorT [Shimia sediminis]